MQVDQRLQEASSARERLETEIAGLQRSAAASGEQHKADVNKFHRYDCARDAFGSPSLL